MKGILKVALGKLAAYLTDKQASCRIVEINTQTQEVVLHLKNRALFLRYTLTDAIADLSIIDEMSPWEACWLGGHYGKVLRGSLKGRNALKSVKKMSFLLKNKPCQYKIVFQNRDGNIGYIDQRTGQEFVEPPLAIVSSQYILSKFDSRQACYIGVLAGISFEKAINELDNIKRTAMLNKRPLLRIVK